MIFEQIKADDGDNFSYIIGDEKTKEVAIIDPGFSAKQLLKIIEQRDLKVNYIINTHSHRDNSYGNSELSKKFKTKIVSHKNSKVDKDIAVDEDDILVIGNIKLKVMFTPGHSPDSICLIVDSIVLTGDTLFVGECGRTDLQGGSPKELYYSLFKKLMSLPDDYKIYPGHDYGTQKWSTIGFEKKTNYVLEERSLDDFIDFMAR